MALKTIGLDRTLKTLSSANDGLATLTLIITQAIAVGPVYDGASITFRKSPLCNPCKTFRRVMDRSSTAPSLPN